MIADKSFLAIIANIYETDFFDVKFGSEIFEVCKNHFSNFKDVPQKEILINSINGDVSLFLEEIENIDVDIIRNREHILAETDKHLKEKAIKKAIMNSVDIIDKNEDIAKIKDLVEEALCKTVWVDLGLRYFEQLGERLKRILENSVKRVPTYFPTFDENISGGFPVYTLSIITAAIHGGKSNLLANMAARQVLQGNNIALLTLEMSEDAFAQRFDSILSGLDINLMYTCKDRRKLLISSLKNYKNKESRGEVFIKQFPTGAASVRDFSAYIRELNMRGIDIDIIYADYINLMKPQYKSKGDSYTDVKRISEELRALSFELKVPVVSVTQLNREGMGSDFSSVGMTNVAECLDLNSEVDVKVNSTYKKQKIKDIKIGDILNSNDGDVIVKRVFPIKRKPMYRIRTKAGKEIICSCDHKIPSDRGVISINEGLSVGARLNTKSTNI